jgi:hypothetical protein
MTIRQTIDIPVSRNVHFDVSLPQDMPYGRTEVVLHFKPSAGQSGTPVSDAKPKLDPVLEKLLQEAEAKRLYNQAHPEKLQECLKNLRDGGPLFDGIDGVAFQRKIRDEWEDRLMSRQDITG